MIVECVIVLLAVAITRFVLYRRRFVRALADIPGPKGVPVLGNALQLVLSDTTGMHDAFDLWVKQCGPRTKLDLCTKFQVVHSSPEDIEQIATSNTFNRKSVEYDHLHEWLGIGILLDHGSSWHKSRKALTEAFHFKVLDNFLPIYAEQSEILVEKLLASEGSTVDIFPILKLFTLEVILETAMGVDCNAQKNDSAYVRAVSGLTQITHWRMYNLIGQLDITFRFSKYYQPYRKMLQVSNDFTMEVISRRRTEMTAGAEGSKDQRKRLVLLDKLIAMEIDGAKLTDEEIRCQVNSFMFAGHDTTSSALTFIVYLLAKHPEVQEKLFTEVEAVLGGDMNAVLNPGVLNNLKYMDQVIKESLRIFPPVPLVGRTIDVDTTLSGVRYPAGTSVSMSIFFMHRNPAYFPEPTRFKPERFDADAGGNHRNPYVYIPFSAGGRNCIGIKFAMNAMKVALCHVIMRLRAELEDPDFEPRLKTELILKPADGMPVRFLTRVS